MRRRGSFLRFVAAASSNFLRLLDRWSNRVFCIMMSMENVNTNEEAENSTKHAGGSNKKDKPKGAPHELRWDVLENEDIKAERGWELVKGLWTSNICKKYVKMYHIGKLWPREELEVHSKAHACKSSGCKDDLFIHRAHEVWRALFGDRDYSKSGFQYGLLAMVYAELILKREVNWGTFRGTKAYPILIAKNQKHVPDMFDPESALTKFTLETLNKKVRAKVVLDAEDQKLERTEDEGHQVATDGVYKEKS